MVKQVRNNKRNKKHAIKPQQVSSYTVTLWSGGIDSGDQPVPINSWTTESPPRHYLGEVIFPIEEGNVRIINGPVTIEPNE